MSELQEQRQLTHENVQRKQARTGEERDEEDEEQPSESESEDEDNEIIYNPKNLPLGWDGKVGPHGHVITAAVTCHVNMNREERSSHFKSLRRGLFIYLLVCDSGLQLLCILIKLVVSALFVFLLAHTILALQAPRSEHQLQL